MVSYLRFLHTQSSDSTALHLSTCINVVYTHVETDVDRWKELTN